MSQCVLRVGEHSMAKAEGRDEGVRGSVFHAHEEDGLPVLAPAGLVGRVGGSLREVRRSRALSHPDLAGLAGVRASAIFQGRAGRTWSLVATLLRLSSVLGVTIDDLLHGEDPDVYRIGRRAEDPQRGFERTITLLLGDADSDLRIDLVHLGAREAGAPADKQTGTGIVAVDGGRVHVQVAGQIPAVRYGEVLVADSERVEGGRTWARLAVLFWIASPGCASRLRALGGHWAALTPPGLDTGRMRQKRPLDRAARPAIAAEALAGAGFVNAFNTCFVWRPPRWCSRMAPPVGLDSDAPLRPPPRLSRRR